MNCLWRDTDTVWVHVSNPPAEVRVKSHSASSVVDELPIVIFLSHHLF